MNLPDDIRGLILEYSGSFYVLAKEKNPNIVKRVLKSIDPESYSSYKGNFTDYLVNSSKFVETLHEFRKSPEKEDSEKAKELEDRMFMEKRIPEKLEEIDKMQKRGKYGNKFRQFKYEILEDIVSNDLLSYKEVIKRFSFDFDENVKSIEMLRYAVSLMESSDFLKLFLLYEYGDIEGVDLFLSSHTLTDSSLLHLLGNKVPDDKSLAHLEELMIRYDRKISDISGSIIHNQNPDLAINFLRKIKNSDSFTFSFYKDIHPDVFEYLLSLNQVNHVTEGHPRLSFITEPSFALQRKLTERGWSYVIHRVEHRFRKLF